MIFVSLIGVSLYGLFVSTVHQTYEYSFVVTFISQLINLGIGLLVFSLYIKKSKENVIIRHLIYIFIAQSTIQFISFVSPEINELLNFFRNENAISIGQEGYGNLRGLSISGSAFFGLGAVYGLIYIVYIINWDKLFKNNKLLKIAFFILLIFGGLSAARTSLVGILFGVLYLIIKRLFVEKYVFKYNLNIKPLKTITSVLLLFSLLISLYFIGLTEQFNSQFQRFMNFAFQFVYNYLETGEVYTTSTNTLFNKMYFKISDFTLLVGDGLYTNPDGSYYMNTDAGYMRDVLYFGIPGVIFLFIYQTTFFLWRRKKHLLQNIIIIFYILIVHIKGDVLGYLIMMQNILFLVFLFNYFNNKKDNILKKNT